MDRYHHRRIDEYGRTAYAPFWAGQANNDDVRAPTFGVHFAPPIEQDGFDLAESLATNVKNRLDALEAADPLEAAWTGEHQLNTGAAM